MRIVLFRVGRTMLSFHRETPSAPVGKIQAPGQTLPVSSDALDGVEVLAAKKLVESCGRGVPKIAASAFALGVPDGRTEALELPGIVV